MKIVTIRFEVPDNYDLDILEGDLVYFKEEIENEGYTNVRVEAEDYES